MRKADTSLPVVSSTGWPSTVSSTGSPRVPHLLHELAEMLQARLRRELGRLIVAPQQADLAAHTGESLPSGSIDLTQHLAGRRALVAEGEAGFSTKIRPAADGDLPGQFAELDCLYTACGLGLLHYVPGTTGSRHTVRKRIGQHSAALRALMPHLTEPTVRHLLRRCQLLAGEQRSDAMPQSIVTMPASPREAASRGTWQVPGRYNDAATVYSEAVSLFRWFKTGSKRLGSEEFAVRKIAGR